jgi:F0F1-type ATP synthase membrane subunit c/vacuolar-type H+-ATPase subunit K
MGQAMIAVAMIQTIIHQKKIQAIIQNHQAVQIQAQVMMTAVMMTEMIQIQAMVLKKMIQL